MEEKKNETLTIKKETLWKYSTFILGALVIVLLFMMFSQDRGAPTGNVIADNPPPTINQPSAPSAVTASVDDDAVLGDKKAKVTIIEFSDYQCPFCGRHFSQTYPLIKSQYVDTGKVKMAFRDFPLSFHQNAMPAAIAAECVKEKGGDAAYWKIHDKLYENQQSLSKDNMKAWAKELGYDIGTCLDSEKFKSEVQKDMADGQKAGTQGTPYFIIMGSDGKGTVVSGAQPFDAFKQVIDTKL